MVYRQTCDASAALRIEGTELFVAASDEDSVLRTFSVADGGAPLTTTDVAAFLEPDSDDTEADIEGAAQIGDRIYWIGSHGRSKKAKEKKIRQRLFATRIRHAGGRTELIPVGRPYKDLLRDLKRSPALAHLDLAAAAEKRPEEDGGLNIEGLAPTPDGHLLIGFRNPVRDAHATVLRLTNPGGLINGTETAADVTVAAALNLGGRGVRALEFVPALGLYLVLAGAFDDRGNFALYRWSGDAAEPAVAMPTDFAGLKPEELIVIEVAGSRLTCRFLSDDGSDECKAAAPGDRSFRAVDVDLDFSR